MSTSARELVGINAMAAELGVTRRRLQEWAMDGTIPYEHSENGLRLYFDREAVWRRFYEMSGRGPKGESCVTLHSQQDTARALGISTAQLDKMTRDGDIPCFYTGRRFVYALDVVMALEFVRELEKSRQSKFNGWRRVHGLPVPADDVPPVPAAPTPTESEGT